MKNKVCNNINYQQSELSDLLYKMAVNCPDEASKFNKWYSGMKTDQDLRNYFCGGGNNLKNNNTKKLREDNIHYQPNGPNEYVKKGSLDKCFHIGQFSVEQVNSGKPFTCDRCKKSLTKETLALAYKEYAAVKRYTGNEDVDENGNIVSGPSAGGNQISSSSQNITPSNSIINQYNDNPIEVKKEKSFASPSLNDSAKNSLLSKIKNEIPKIDNFNEEEINKLLNIKEDIITKPIFDTFYYSNFTDAIYKTVEDSESIIPLEDVAGYNFNVTFTVKATGFIENIRFQNETGIGSTPKINQSIKAIMFKLGMKVLWIPATKNNIKINDDVTIEIDVDKYLKSYYYLKNLKKDVAGIEQKERKKNEAKEELAKNNFDVKEDKSYYQNFIDFKNRLIKDISTNSQNSKVISDDKSVAITEEMEDDAKKGLLKLLAKPNVSMLEVRNYISSRIKSINKGLKGIWEEKLAELDGLLLQIK